MKAKILVTILAVLALAAGLVPSLAFAAQEGVVPGAFTLGNIAPTVNSITLYEAANGVVSTMSPQTEYFIRVSITDPNSIVDLDRIYVYLYYDADGAYNYGDMPTAGDTHTCAIMYWQRGLGFWKIEPASGTTWSYETGNCTAPADAATTGNFDFHFKPGKAALETEAPSQWHVYVEVHDVSNTGTLYATGYSMYWYGEMYAMSPSVHWSNVSLGDDDVPADNTVSATIISNGDYAGQIKSSSPWEINGSTQASLNAAGTPGNAQFSLKAEGTGNLGAAIQVETTYTTFYDAGTYTSDIGYIYPTNALWLSVGETGLVSGTYTGVITYKLTTR